MIGISLDANHAIDSGARREHFLKYIIHMKYIINMKYICSEPVLGSELAGEPVRLAAYCSERWSCV